MDIQRLVIYAGLAIVSYLMVLAWNEDYNSQPATIAQQQTAPAMEDGNGTTAELEAPESTSNAADEFATPEAGTGRTERPDTTTTDEAAASLVSVKTDVLDLKIDPRGGNLVSGRLLQYDKTLEGQQPLPLLTRGNGQTYILESGLIGRDGIDTRKNGDPLFSALKKPTIP